MKSTVFFDMDGVLVVTEPLHQKAWENLLSQLNVEFELSHSDFVGISDKVMAQHFIDSHTLPHEIHDLCNMKREIFLELIQDGFPSPDGRDEFLQFLKGKMQIGVVSTASRQEVTSVLTREKILDQFDFFVVNEDTSRHKPDPMPYLTALKKANVEPHEVTVIEDSVVGIQSAQSAGLDVIALATSFESFPMFPNVPIYRDFHEIKKGFK